MRRVFLLFAVLLFHSFSVFSQSFSGGGGQIPDDGTSIDFTINVSGLPTTIDTSTFGLESICFNILHTYDSDLNISIISPDGSQVLLVNGVGGGDDNFIATCLTSNAALSIVQGTAPFSGNFKPTGQMGLFNNGQNPNGIWKLRILDTYPFADQGVLLGWSLYFGNNPAVPFSFHSSNLPIVKINTQGQQIVVDPKITAYMEIIDNGPGVRNNVTDSANSYSGYIGIDIRGHSSSGFPQKQYNVETRDSLGNNNDVSILGMPVENDWVLYGAYNDKSLMRNVITYTLANQMGRYASRCKYCEVVIDGEYKGVYTFMEKVKKDNNRVDVSTLTATDTSGVELTGGYICSIDWADNGGWYSNYPPDQTSPVNNQVYYQYIYPKDIDILPQQQTYIQQFVDSFETALLAPDFDDPVNGWRKYGDEGSFIDYFIMNELSKNVDGYRLSSYFYKEKITSGGKINMGPLWDFNLAWHNADYCSNPNPGGWAYEITNYCSWDFPFWWRKMITDTLFQDNLRCRWDYLRTNVLDSAHIYNMIDSIASLVNEGQERHYTVWPVLGVYLWPNPAPIAVTYQEEITNLKDWIGSRLQFMDANLPGTCLTSGFAEYEGTGEVTVSPNPARDKLVVHISSTSSKLTASVYDLFGKQVTPSISVHSGQAIIPLDDLISGVYIVHVNDGSGWNKSVRFIKL